MQVFRGFSIACFLRPFSEGILPHFPRARFFLPSPPTPCHYVGLELPHLPIFCLSWPYYFVRVTLPEAPQPVRSVFGSVPVICIWIVRTAFASVLLAVIYFDPPRSSRVVFVDILGLTNYQDVPFFSQQ